jgi:thiol:disulfide interchange protein DsbG
MKNLSFFYQNILALLFLLFTFSGLSAKDAVNIPLAPLTKTTTAPDPSNYLILNNLIKMGAKIYYLGNRSGLDGWFILKDNQVQIAYTTADSDGVLVGVLFDKNGENITTAQLSNLALTNKELAESLNATSKTPTTAMSASTGTEMSSAVPNGLTTAIQSPGEKLLQELTNATGVTIGNSSAPQIMMVMDPNCPHCQATWRGIRDSVFKNSLRIRLIPVVRPESDNERAAAVLVQSGDALNSWDKYVAGDKSQLAGNADPAIVVNLRMNHALIDSWHISTTPYIVYRGKDGKVKIIQGEPTDIAKFLADVL